MNIFKLNDEGIPELIPEFYEIECFKTVQHRMRKMDGDADGRKKLLNAKELRYIYFNGFYGSRYLNFEKKQREEDLINDLRLPSDWKPDEEVKACIKYYVNYQKTPSWKLYIALSNMAEGLTDYADSKAQGLTALKPKEVLELMSVIKEAPLMIENLAKAKKQLEMESDAKLSGKAGRAINKFELKT
jgi:hypothetical protein